MAARSPGSALVASCAATSVGSAPAASRTSTACRSSARRTDTGQLIRTASRITSCRKARRPSCSRRTCVWTSCSTPVSNVDGGASSIFASSANENVRPNDAATVANWRADSDMRASRPRMPWLTRSGSRFSISSHGPPAIRTRCSSRSPRAVRRGRMGCRPPRGPSAAARIGLGAQRLGDHLLDRRRRQRLQVDPDRASRRSAGRTPRGAGADDSSGRAASSQTIGSDARRLGSSLRAATVPASAHCRSSSHTSIGFPMPLARVTSGDPRASSTGPPARPGDRPVDARLRSGGDPPNSARNIGASSAAPSPGSAALPPTASEDGSPSARSRRSGGSCPSRTAPRSGSPIPTPSAAERDIPRSPPTRGRGRAASASPRPHLTGPENRPYRPPHPSTLD